MELAPGRRRPKMLARSLATKSYVQYRICSERGNCPHRSQRDPTRGDFPEEVLDDSPFGDRGTEAPSARARARAAASRPGRPAARTRCGKRGHCLARHSLQRKEHGVAAAPSRLVSCRMRPADRRLRAVCLQLGRGQGASARPASAGHLCPEEPGAPASERDLGDAQSSLSGARARASPTLLTGEARFCGNSGRLRSLPPTGAQVHQSPGLGRSAGGHRVKRTAQRMTTWV